ncbi:hypothetical protein PR202_gb04249 [Eleusine coracana subsp. coracana]|uniref:RNB domain-containing protein n=1 Tax=Eleusine coracana subsp. coracana TaxID=191504 RepID=A0AAV5E2H3_ELECO|nr:hypothetical protein PR202_gb04249 [Eleusine coracana subsp. coracana]
MRPSPMAARAAGGYSSAALAFFRLRPLRRAVRPAAVLAGGCSSLHGGCRSRLAHNLVDSVLEELRSRRRVRVSAKLGLQGTKELSDNKIDKRTLQKGLLLEFQKDSERSLLAVVERPDGKKNWIVTDQNGILSSIKPQQVTYVVPGILNFDYSRIVEFLEKAQDLLDPTVLECAWMELSEEDKPITVEEFAEILKAMGFSRTSSAALKLLINVGYLPVHVNLDLIKYDVRIRYTEEVLSAAEELLVDCPDSDLNIRKDLSTLKVYAIDVDEADELDDALSATRLPDGRIKILFLLHREAMHRGTSVFLPTATFPMFPERLAMNAMSLQQSKECKSVSVAVILDPDGSGVRSQGSIDTAMIEPRIKVANPDDPEPNINLYVEDQNNPAMQLVSEMMILCGEAVAAFGSDNNLPLPYRGHPQSNASVSAFSHVPEGPARSFANIGVLRAAEMDFQKPVPHGVLGIPGYVQFTSPIRRYVDLLAHYQAAGVVGPGEEGQPSLPERGKDGREAGDSPADGEGGAGVGEARSRSWGGSPLARILSSTWSPSSKSPPPSSKPPPEMGKEAPKLGKEAGRGVGEGEREGRRLVGGRAGRRLVGGRVPARRRKGAGEAEVGATGLRERERERATGLRAIPANSEVFGSELRVREGE